MNRWAVPLGAFLSWSMVASAQPDLLTNARVEVVSASGNLERVFETRVASQSAAAWIAYAVPIARGDRFVCDWSEGTRGAAPTSVKLEGGDRLYVFFRTEARSVNRIRMFSEGCAIDAGGLPLTWVNDVEPGQSVRLLARYVSADMPRRVADGALAALALHDNAAATTVLFESARIGATARLRGQALFWIAQRAGDRAIPAITEALDTDPDTDVKKRAVFALSQLPDGEGVPRLIEVAEHHSNAAVRKQAMFWLGQSRDPRALAFFERVLLK